jgi:hypothetical protein
LPDSYGAVSLPLPAVTLGSAAGDVLLSSLASFLKACLNYYANDAWQDIAPARGDCVRSTQTNDPADSTFNAADLPALYVWRDARGTTFEQLADDIEVCNSQIRIVWVPPPGVQMNRSEWAPFLHQVAKVIDYALWNERDPAWVHEGDTDPDAVTRGSHWMRIAGLFYSPNPVMRVEIVPIQIAMADGSQGRSYQGVHCIIETTEELDASAPLRFEKFPPLMTATLSDEDGATIQTVDGHDPLLRGGFADSTDADYLGAEFDAGIP